MGSLSSFNSLLRDQIQEPTTGRIVMYLIFQFSLARSVGARGGVDIPSSDRLSILSCEISCEKAETCEGFKDFAFNSLLRDQYKTVINFCQ